MTGRTVLRVAEEDADGNVIIPLTEEQAAFFLAPGGVFAMIHRAEALADCLAAVEGRLGGVSVQAVFTRPGAPATRILLRGTKGSKAPLSLLEPRRV